MLGEKEVSYLEKKEKSVVFGEKKCILLRNDCVVVCSISLHITLVHTHKRTPKHNIRLLYSFERGKLSDLQMGCSIWTMLPQLRNHLYLVHPPLNTSRTGEAGNF